jgi:hypothetical protein
MNFATHPFNANLGTMTMTASDMNKAAFALAFQDAVETACRSAEKSLGKTLSRDVIVRMYGAGTDGLDVSPRNLLIGLTSAMRFSIA